MRKGDRGVLKDEGPAPGSSGVAPPSGPPSRPASGPSSGPARLAAAWSGRDAFIYAFFSINLVTLGLYIVSQAWYFHGGMIPALLAGALLVFSEVLVYAALIVAIPGSGGDYLWQSSILGKAAGFILAITGWCFILWLWTPIYGDILRQVVLVPLAAVLGFGPAAIAISSSRLVWFAIIALMVLFVLVVIARGMAFYAKVQRYCFWAGNAGLLAVAIALLAGDRSNFHAIFDLASLKLFGITNAYEAVRTAGEAAGATTPLWGGGAARILLLLPFLAFFNLWPNTGASLSGEVRGAHEFGRNVATMGGALAATTALLILVLLAIDKGIGWNFYMDANAAYWNGRSHPEAAAAQPYWPYPALLAVMTIPSTFLRVLILLAMGAWFFGWAGTIYLSSTRIIFSAAFDRLLPAGLAQVDEKTKSPFKALLFMVVPGLIVSALYVWNVFGFASLTLMSTAVIAITFLGTAATAILFPFVKRDLYLASPLGRRSIGPLPLISLAGLVFAAFLGYLLYEWLVDPSDLFGISWRNATSLVFLAAMYALAALLYLGLRGLGKKPASDIDAIFEDKE